MTDYILNRISTRLPGLSRSEAIVARWVLIHHSVASHASIAEVASRAGVSEPTVIRFCRSLGLEGFRDLRNHLIAASHRPESYSHQSISREDSIPTAANKVLQSCTRALVDLTRLVATLPITDAVTALSKARQITFVGVGASGHVAEDACHKFFRLGIPCSSAVDAQTMRQRAAIAGPEDVIVVISHTGRWQDTVKSMEIARERGACIIAITATSSRLAETASIVLDCHPAEDTSVFTPMISRLSHLALLDAIQVSLTLALGSDAENNLRLTKQALLNDEPPQLVNSDTRDLSADH